MIGTKLKEIRETTGMNKKEFAQYLGLKYTTYNNYETEAREPASDFLILVSEKFDVSIDYLLGLREECKILHSYQLYAEEYAYIKKYRDLDDHGKEMVDFTLKKEWERSTYENKSNNNIVEYATSSDDNLSTKAAHNDYLDNPEEQEKINRDMEKLRRPE